MSIFWGSAIRSLPKGLSGVPWLGSTVAVVGLILSSAARAQDPSTVAPSPQPKVWIEPRVSAGVIVSSNGSRSTSNPEAEQVLEVSPGLRLVFNNSRVQGFADYAVSGRYYAQGSSSDNFRQALDARGTLNVWDNRAFVDFSGTINDQSISAFGPQVQGLGDLNRSETANFRASPYVRGSLGGLAEYEARYALQSVNTQTASRSDLTIQDLALKLGSPDEGRVFGWLFDANLQSVDYSLGRDTRSSSLGAGVIYSVSPQLRLTLRAGVESNDIVSVSRESYNTYGLDTEWRPSNRTRFFAALESRYFGTGHNISLEHRTGKTVWRYIDTRRVANTQAETAVASLGSIYGLLDSLFASAEPDPVQRAQLVQAELLRLGLPADSTALDSFLSSSATLDRYQSLSLALVGVRTVLTFAVTRNSSTRLNPLSSFGDDFDTNGRIQQQGWSIVLAHRLTPRSSFNASVNSQRSAGTGLVPIGNRTNSLSLGLTTRLAPRTSGTLQLRRVVYDSVNSPYAETVVSALLTHRF